MGGTRAKKPAGKGAKAKRKSRRAARFQGATETTKRKQTSQPGRPKKRQKTAPTDLVGERAKKPTRRAEKPQNGTRNSSRKLDRPVTGKAKSGLPTQARKEKSHKAARKRDPEKEELIDKIVKKWESMRSRNVSKEERKRIAKEVLSAVSGWVPKLAMNHKGSRVLQHILKQGGEQEWRRIANEALPHVVHLAQSKHGSFLARKIASKSPRGSHKRVLRAIQGNVPRLARSATGCAVLEAAYARGSGYQRWQLVSELYGREFALFGPAGAKGSDPREAVRNDPGKRKQVVQSLAQSLFPALERGYVAFEFVHKALCDFLLNAGEKAVNEAAEQLDPRALPRMVHTREGVTCASIVYFAYSPKRRKAALKAFRPHVRDMCFDDCAHAFVMAALDVTDDTVALRDHVITPLFEGETGLLDLVCNAYGRRPLLHLVCPRSQRHFPPQVQFCLPKRTESEHGLTTPSTSQKDPDKRRREILGQPGGLASSLVSLCRSSPRALLSSKVRVWTHSCHLFLPLPSLCVNLALADGVRRAVRGLPWGRRGRGA